jgi:hypothetical protein
MTISNKPLRYDLDILRRGGAEGAGHFLEMGQKYFYQGGQELLNDWIEAAAPALPAADRYSSIGALMSSLFGDDDVTDQVQPQPYARLVGYEECDGHDDGNTHKAPSCFPTPRAANGQIPGQKLQTQNQRKPALADEAHSSFGRAPGDQTPMNIDIAGGQTSLPN